MKKVFVFSLTLLFVLTTISSTSWGKGKPFKDDELLVYFLPKREKHLNQEVAQFEAAVSGTLSKIHVKRIKVKDLQKRDKVKAKLLKSQNVITVEENFLAEPLLLPNDVNYDKQWHFAKIQAPDAWNISTGSEQVPIAIIDSGIDLDHPDLEQKILPGYNFLDDSTNGQDVEGHGTAVAGAAAAITDNINGIAGVSWGSPVVPLVVLNSSNYASYYDMARAIIWAADQGIKVINISLGGTSSSVTLQNAVNYAWNKGCLIFAAAANANTSTRYYPAACDNVISVAATDGSDNKASFSNYGDWIDISAPGTYIYTTQNGGGYANSHGTSFSSPIAAGLAALVWSVDPDLTNVAVQQIIEDNANDLGANGFDHIFGHGRINASESILAAATLGGNLLPHVAITSPTDGMQVSGVVDIVVDASDDQAIDLIELYVNGTLTGSSTQVPSTFSWTAPNQAGSYLLTAKAYDVNGSTSSSSISVSVAAEYDSNSGAPIADPNGTYFEAENFSGSIIQGTASYKVESVEPGFVGSGYLKAYGSSYDTPPQGEGREYRIYFPESGIYNFWVRGQGFSGTSDSLYFGLNGQAVGAISPPVGGWVWSASLFWNSNSLSIPAPGEYAVNVFVREGDFLLDGIYLTKGTEVPSGGVPPGASVINPAGDNTTTDTTAPVVSFTNPQDGEKVSGTIGIEVDAQDDNGVVQVELLVNGTHVATDTGAPYTFSWQAPAQAGTYQLTAKAIDGALNTSTASIKVTVPPPSTGSVPAIDPKGTYIEAENFSGSIIQGSAHFTVEDAYPEFNGSGYLKANGHGGFPPSGEGKEYQVYFPEAGDYRFWVRGMGFDGGSDSIYFGLNGQAAGAISTPVGGWVWSNNLWWNANQLSVPSAGEYTVNVFIREGDFLLDGIYLTKGNEKPTGSIPPDAVVIDPNNMTTEDVQAPKVVFNSPLDGMQISGDVLVSVSATDASGIDRVEFLADSTIVNTDLNAPYEFTWNAPAEAGVYQLTARAYDTAQNVAVVSISVTVPEQSSNTAIIDPFGTYIEAENFSGSISQGAAYYTVEDDYPEFNGNGYLKANGHGGFPPSGEGKKYQVYFPESGNYRFWVRGMGFDGGSDSIYFGLNGQAAGAISAQVGGWVWSNNLWWNANQLSVPSAGEYTINVFIRESDFLLDGIYLTKGSEKPMGGIPIGATVIDPR